MDERLTRLLEQTRDAHRIMEYDERETADDRLRRKPALRSRLVDDCESLENWKALTPYAKVELSDEHAYEGRHSIRFSAPTNLPDWLPGRGRGRIYAEPGAMRVLPHEDLTEWNRISVCVRPEIPGMRSVCLRVQLYNEGDHPVPDRYMREGAHNVNLKNGEWNHITVEIPYLHRNDAVGIALEYDMCGHEFDAADTAVWYIDKLELQYVEPEMYEGWVPGRGRIAFSGSGYRPDGRKLAIAGAEICAERFRVLETETGRCAYEGEVRRENGLAVMDFTALRTPGRYLLLAGELSTRVFPIDERVWEPSVWKVLNFYLSQRCGWDVPGKHHACHTDLLLKHNGRAIVANGGWHDAADLAQGMNNTSDGTAALFRLARRLKGAQGLAARLYERVLEEARWGLDYVLKTRFGDGYRSSYSSTSIWTDGVIGTEDDILSEPSDDPFANFCAACAEALGAEGLRESDPAYAAYSLKIAREDFCLAERRMPKEEDGTVRYEVNLFAAAAAAAAELVRAGAAEFEEPAVRYARLLMECQQTEWPDWNEPIRGFFWRDRGHTLPSHFAHFSCEQYYTAGLAALVEVLPAHEDCPRWKHALSLYCEYARAAAAHTAPWYMLPEGVYHENEAIDYPKETLADIIWGTGEELKGFKDQVHNGIALGRGYYLRRFPVWFSFRGNLNVLLSQTAALAMAAQATGDADARQLVERQLEWTVGRNPFAQSLIFGEGYDWTNEYAVQPGQTVGQMPVGIQSLWAHDAPYWPQVCTATYKEVWISPANKWMWTLSACL